MQIDTQRTQKSKRTPFAHSNTVTNRNNAHLDAFSPTGEANVGRLRFAFGVTIIFQGDDRMFIRRRQHQLYSAIIQDLEPRTLFSAYTITSIGGLITATSQPGSQTGVVIDAQGNIFGTTYMGGTNSAGSIVEIPAATKQIITLASFDITDGESPIAIALDSAGDLFGIAQYGGNANANLGEGSLFEIPAGTNTIDEKIIYNSNTTLGYFPEAMALDQSTGNIYVLLSKSGDNAAGLVEKVSPTTFAETAVAYLTTPTTALPNTLTLASNGYLYGTVFGDGTAGDPATIFSIAPGSSTATTLASFGGTNPTGQANQPFVDSAGNIWIATPNGGIDNVGAIDEIPAGTTTINTVASFLDTSFFDPLTSLIQDSSGNLYGTTTQSSGEYGVLFKFSTTTHALTSEASFSMATGYTSEAGLVADASGNFYGSTSYGGSGNTGSIFEASPNANGGVGTGGGTTTTPTTGVTPVVTKNTLPTSVISGQKITKGTLSLSITNDGTSLEKGTALVSLYASTDGTVDSSSTLISSVKRSVNNLKATKSTKVSFSPRSLALPVGTYTLLAQATDASGNVIAASTGPTLSVVAPVISLSATLGPVTPLSVKPGKTISFALTIFNSGNINSTGLAYFALGLSSDGTTLAVSLPPTQKKSLTIKPGIKPVVVHLKVKIPLSQAAGLFYPFVTFTQGTNAFSIVGTSGVTIV